MPTPSFPQSCNYPPPFLFHKQQTMLKITLIHTKLAKNSNNKLEEKNRVREEAVKKRVDRKQVSESEIVKTRTRSEREGPDWL